MTDLPIEQILLDCVSQIGAMGIPYAIMGGFAARIWGLPRPTFDADVAIAVDHETLGRLLTALEGAGFDVPDEHARGFLDRVADFEKLRVTRFEEGHVWTTDLFLAEGPFLRSALARARDAEIGGRIVRVMAPEDIVLLKLIAGRRKDLADIDDILELCDLDLGYLRLWAHRLKITDRLEPFFPD